MILNNLPSNVAQQIVNLTEDQQFQKRFAEDKLLDHLQAQKHDRNITMQELLLLLNRKTLMFGTAFKPITLSLFCYLYCIKSNIVGNLLEMTTLDLDVFFYLLQTKDYTSDMKRLLQKSENYCENELELNYNQALYVFNKIYQIEFKVFSLFPRVGDDEDEEAVYDLDWVTNIASKVKPFTSYTTQQLYTQVPVMEIYYYYAQYLRSNGSDSIFLRSNEQILDEMDSRTIVLVLDRLIQKKVITPDKKQEYFDLMKNIKENKDGQT